MPKHRYTVFSASNIISQPGSCILYELHIPNSFEHLHHIEHIAVTLTWEKKSKKSYEETGKKQQILKQTQTVPAWVLERKGTMVSYFQTDQIHRNISVFDMMLRGKSSTCI